jgi:C-terminal processing protease CtpA/Prc
LTAPHLIVDLRDNTGGATKVSAKFVRLIRRAARKGRVYVLINNGAMSQGEIVTLQLKQYANVRVYGQTTKGTIAYGVNTGGMKKLPSKQYGAVMTDMKDKGHYFPYENYGVAPDTVLGNTGDWIELVVQEIGHQ